MSDTLAVQPVVPPADTVRPALLEPAPWTGVHRPELPKRRHAVSIWGQVMLNLPASAWMLVDVMILTAAIWVGYSLFVSPETTPYPHVHLWQACLIFSVCLVVSSLVFGLYERETLLGQSRILTRILLTSTMAVVLTYAAVYVVMYTALSRRVTGLAIGSYVLMGSSIRTLAWWAIQRVKRGLLVVGPGLLVEAFERASAEGLLPHYRLAGFASAADHPSDRLADIHRLRSTREIPAFCRQQAISDLVVGSDAARDPQVMTWLLPCLRMGCRVTNEATFYEKATGQILVDQITPHWFLFADLKAHCDEAATLKRAIDLAVSVVGLAATLPFWPLIALAIKLDDGGPVFYSHDRVGQNGLVFALHKFRTMRPSAENGTSVWATKNDPRVTRVGRLLRRLRLDELPQLYNVLLGQMSIVGPRPERPDIVEDLVREIPFYSERHLVKPGITGWAQISFRYGSSVEDA
ncbi:MAG: exopolysaccharide biosynthesis polyprenyl glycosylphosphotransferase, partial [Planctomycetota bacterium]